MRTSSAILLPLFTLLAPAALAAQGQLPRQSCTAAEHRQFDFWIGEWEVTGANGQRAGSSRISRVADGCGVLEEWTGANGQRGVSINYYDPATRTWNQHWVGGGGLILHLRGELQEGSMLMGGDRQGAQGPLKDRIRWAPETDGRVRQIWDVSSDNGTTWQPAFNGVYARRT